jgi:hypothetical protein
MLDQKMEIFRLSRRMGTSVAMMEKTYGHLCKDADDEDRELMDAHAARTGGLAGLGRLVDVGPAVVAS